MVYSSIKLKSIEETNNAITVIILIIAVIFLAITVFAFFYLQESLSH